MPSNELDGQVALVTGGGRGIGANIARELASAGMEVWVTGRTADQVEAVAAEARVEELVRMLGGGTPSAATRQHARELLRTP